MGHQMSNPKAGTIQFGRAFHADLHYHVLSHLDLGRDAANLLVKRTVVPVWTEALRAAYLKEHPASLTLQFTPLYCADLDALKQKLDDETTEVKALMWQAVESEAISVSRGAEILGLSLGDIRELAKTWVDVWDGKSKKSRSS